MHARCVQAAVALQRISHEDWHSWRYKPLFKSLVLYTYDGESTDGRVLRTLRQLSSLSFHWFTLGFKVPSWRARRDPVYTALLAGVDRLRFAGNRAG